MAIRIKTTAEPATLASPDAVSGLPVMIDRAATALAGARTFAEVMEAEVMAKVARSAAKAAARLAKVKDAHDGLIAAAHRMQGDALEIELAANRRLADEIDAGQERGEVQKAGGNRTIIPDANNAPAKLTEIGITAAKIHEARTFRDAELAEPGVTERTVLELLEAGHEPTKAAVRQALVEAVERGPQRAPRKDNRKPDWKPNPLADDRNRMVDICTQAVEILQRRTPAELLGACYDEEERARMVKTIRAGIAAITTFEKEFSDAQQAA